MAQKIRGLDALGERLRQLEEENAKLKRIVADMSLDKAMRPARKRKLVDTIKADWKVSIRRACSVLKVDRSLYVYKSRRGEQAELKLKIKDICQTRVRYGDRRVHILIRREGSPVNPKRIYRLYKEMDLQLRNKVPKRRVKAKLRADRTEPTHSNHVWWSAPRFAGQVG